jgi:hypothetical protein
MATHNGLFNHLKPNNHLDINELNATYSHIELNEDLNDQHLQNKHDNVCLSFINYYFIHFWCFFLN